MFLHRCAAKAIGTCRVAANPGAVYRARARVYGRGCPVRAHSAAAEPGGPAAAAAAPPGEAPLAQPGTAGGSAPSSAQPEELEGSELLDIPPEVHSLFDILRGEAIKRLDEFDPIHLFSLCWAYSTARLLDEGLHQQITDAALRLGKKRDQEAARGPKARSPEPASRSGEGAGADEPAQLPQHEQPSVVAEGAHWMALYKPPYWQVSVDSKEAARAATITPFGDDDEGDVDDEIFGEEHRRRPKMHLWIRQFLAQHYPICTDPLEAYGLLHRIDMQTSGLLVCAKSYVGAYWLRLQWCSYLVDKEYVCLVHGWVDPSVREVHKRIRVDKKKAKNSRRTVSTHCSVGASGKPSYTEVCTLARFTRPPAEGAEAEDQRYSLVVLKLHTGRTHQIRVHMLSIGHPLVSDEKYAPERHAADRVWCPRNFLHTYHLCFGEVPGHIDEVPEEAASVPEESGQQAEAQPAGAPGAVGEQPVRERGPLVDLKCPLPEDLRGALALLQPVDGASAQLHADWLAGDVSRLRPFEEYGPEGAGPE